MKTWVKTKLSDKPDVGEFNLNKPLLNGHEDASIISTAEVKPLSSGHILVRVVGMPTSIIPIIEDAKLNLDGMQLLTDDESEILVRTELIMDVSQLEIQRGNISAFDLIPYPGRENWSCESCDCADPEIDTIAKSLGLDPHQIRSTIQMPSRGKQVLQDQENYLLAQISTKKGKSNQFWDDEAVKSGKYPKGIDIDNAILDGKGAAQEFVLSRLR
jgi:hypothetical protein